MIQYPRIATPNILKKFIQEIPDTGTPDTLSQAELVQRGYRSHNYRPIIPILKQIQFLDNAGKPTQNWTNYKDKSRNRQVLASCIRLGYSELFKTYPKAQEKDTEALRNFFSTRIPEGKQALDDTVNTFKALTELADFSATEELPSSETEEPKSDKTKKAAIQASPSGLTLNLNIQLTLPATENAEIYDKLFAALKKHLLAPEK